MPKLEHLYAYVKPTIAITPGSKSTGAITATAVDASGGYDRAEFLIHLGTFGTGAGFDAEITESASSGGAYTLIASSGMTLVKSTVANKLVIIDVPVNNAKPFMKVRATVGTAAINVSGLAILYNGTRSLNKTVTDATQTVVV